MCWETVPHTVWETYNTSLLSAWRIWRISSLFAVLRCWMKPRKWPTASALERLSGCRWLLMERQCSESCKRQPDAQTLITSMNIHIHKRTSPQKGNCLYKTSKWSLYILPQDKGWLPADITFSWLPAANTEPWGSYAWFIYRQKSTIVELGQWLTGFWEYRSSQGYTKGLLYLRPIFDYHGESMQNFNKQ